MQFKKDAPVYTADEQQVGAVDRVVLDPQTNEVSHLVIRQGWLFTEDKVVPIELVDIATAERIQLHRGIKNLDELPPFEEVYYIPQGEGDVTAANNTQGTQPDADATAATDEDKATTTTYTTVTDAFTLYGYPPLGLAWPEHDLGYYGYLDELYTVKVKRHIPTGTVALKEGAVVVDSQGERVGFLKRVFTNEETGQITHLLIAEGWLFKEERLLPFAWVKTIGEDEVQLFVKADILNRLPAHNR